MNNHQADSPETDPTADVTPAEDSDTTAASSPRSPNRKPRTRGPLRRYITNKNKELFLALYEATGDTILSRKLAGVNGGPLHRTTVSRWAKRDPEFKAEMSQITEGWRWMTAAAFNALSTKAVKVIEDLLTPGPNAGYRDSALAFRTAQWQLKSQGIGIERTKPMRPIEGSGKPVEIVVVPPTAKALESGDRANLPGRSDQ